MGFDIKGDVISGSKIYVNSPIKTELSAPIMVAFDITNKCNFRYTILESCKELFTEDELNEMLC